MKTCFNSINFRAAFIQKALVEKKTNNLYLPNEASIVCMDPSNQNDVEAIKKAAKKWGKQDGYGKVIASHASKIRNGSLDKDTSKIYLLTTQKDQFDSLIANKILGLSEMLQVSPDVTEIRYLQVNPKYSHNTENREYKSIGKELVNMAKRQYHDFCIVVQSSYCAANFYEKLNFKIFDVEQLLYKWTKARKA